MTGLTTRDRRSNQPPTASWGWARYLYPVAPPWLGVGSIHLLHAHTLHNNLPSSPQPIFVFISLSQVERVRFVWALWAIESWEEQSNLSKKSLQLRYLFYDLGSMWDIVRLGGCWKGLNHLQVKSPSILLRRGLTEQDLKGVTAKMDTLMVFYISM